MMKRITVTFKSFILASLFCLSLILFPAVSQALNVEDVPNPREVSGEWVTDMAEILSAETETQLNSMISELEAKNGTEIAVVTIPKTDADTNTRRFTNELFNHWGIGKAEEDNGILFLISKGDRRARIETGYGIEAILPDAQVGEILETHILPHFKEDDFDTGTLAGTKALIEEVQDAEVSTSSPTLLPKLTEFPIWEQPLILIFRMGMTAGIGIAVTAIVYSQRHRFTPITDSNEETPRISVWHAEVSDRGIALVIDLAFLSLIQMLAFFLIGTFTPVTSQPLQLLLYFPINPEAIFDLTFLVGWTGFGGALLLYRVITEAYFSSTLGKLCLGLRVLKPDNSSMGLEVSRIRQLYQTDEPPVGVKLAFLRNLFLILDGFLCYIVGAVAISKSNTSQRIGDRIAGTIVVRRGASRKYKSPTRWGYGSSGSHAAGYGYVGDSGSFGGSSSGGGFGGGSSGGGGADGGF